MLERLFQELGPWNWMVLGFILLGAEILVPGVFLVWIGIAAIVVGLLTLALWDAGFWVWQVQVLLFLALLLVAAYLGNRVMRRTGNTSDEPLLNMRGEQLVGRTATLAEPIREGHGRIKLDDFMWRVEGPDQPAGARVKVVSSHGSYLTVEPA